MQQREVMGFLKEDAIAPKSASTAKSQSAMEYLMTYGWAILIIAVILGVLFSLGVFNPTNYAPKMPAGGCHVFRPNGPGTSFGAVLVGTCSGFLPQYVAEFNGYNSDVVVTGAAPLQFGGPFTTTVWVYFSANQIVTYPKVLARGSNVSGSFRIELIYSSDQLLAGIFNSNGALTEIEAPISLGVWHFISLTLNSSDRMTLYIDGVSKATGTGGLGSNTLDVYVGSYSNGGHHINGSIANVQMYNASLDANEIQYLYNEGIGGAPVYLQHLAGWWPLNGDTKDYSGNGNNAVPSAMIFNGSWIGGYSPP